MRGGAIKIAGKALGEDRSLEDALPLPCSLLLDELPAA